MKNNISSKLLVLLLIVNMPLCVAKECKIRAIQGARHWNAVITSVDAPGFPKDALLRSIPLTGLLNNGFVNGKYRVGINGPYVNLKQSLVIGDDLFVILIIKNEVVIDSYSQENGGGWLQPLSVGSSSSIDSISLSLKHSNPMLLGRRGDGSEIAIELNKAEDFLSPFVDKETETIYYKLPPDVEKEIFNGESKPVRKTLPEKQVRPVLGKKKICLILKKILSNQVMNQID